MSLTVETLEAGNWVGYERTSLTVFIVLQEMTDLVAPLWGHILASGL